MTLPAPGRIRSPLAALLALLVGTCPPAARAQGPGALAFQTYGSDQGLGSLLVEAMEEDDAGFLWVAGNGGLYRLEDQRFRRIGAAHGLATDAVRSLARDAGGLWVGTEAGLFRFDGQGFERLGRGLPEGASVEAMARDVSGKLWVVVDQRLWTGGREGFRPASVGPALQVWADSGKPRVLVLAADGQLLQTEGEGAEWVRLGRGPDLGGERPGALLQDHAGQVWVRSRTRLFRGEPGRGFQSLAGQLPATAAGEGHLHLDRLGRVWVPTAQGLVVFERGGFSAPRFDFPRSSGLARTALMDREGNLWVAGEEVHRLLGRGSWSLHRTAEGLPANGVRGLLRDAQGRLWAATTLGLARGGAAGWERVPGTEGLAFSALALAPDGQVWAAGPRGLFIRSRGAGVETLAFRGLQDHGGAITALVFDGEGRLWAASEAGGLLRLRTDGGTPVAEPVLLAPPEPGERFSALALDREGRAWAGGQGGLAVLEGSRWARLDLAGIRGPCLALAPAPGGGVWASFGPEGALLRLRWAGARAQVEERIEDFRGLPRDPLVALAVGPGGVLWGGGPKGLLRFGGDGIDLFGKGEGLPGAGCNPGALWADASGDLWAGTGGGIGHFHAAVYRGLPQAPRTEVVEARFGRNTLWDPGLRILRIPLRESSAEFTVATLTHLDPTKLLRQFRLVNFDEAWHDLDGFIARYPRLPPGLYQFEVRSRLVTSGWGPPALLRFEVLTPWYRRWWVLALGALAVGGVLVGGYRRITGALRRRNLALEEVVEQRTLDLKTALEAAEEANRAKDDFLATMSHEIRTPMHAVLGMTGVLLDSGLSREQRESAQTIHHAATALMSIINDILDFAQIEASRIALRSVPFSLRELAEELVDLMAVTAHQKGLELVLRIPSPGPGMLVGDPDRLRQILVNLLGNAIKFTATGFVLLEVESVEQAPDRERLRVSVTDSGVGIAADRQKALFQKFTQADTSIGRRFGGTGLGLAIMRHLVERMGGKVGLRSEEGRGSTFWFEVELPRVEGSLEAGPSDAWSALRIMVVDDLEPARRALADRLSGWGLAVGAAAGLEEACGLLARAAEFQDPFNLVLLDDSLLGGGPPPAIRLREAAGDGPFAAIALCPMHQAVDAAALQDAGLHGLLRKPVHDWELRDTLNGAANQLAGRSLGEWIGEGEAVLEFEAAAQPAAWGGSPPRVLLVEDNPLNRQVALRLLAGLGASAAVAEGGQEAVALAAAEAFDAILMDVHMPGMDGVQATRAIRGAEGGRRTPIVAMTAHALDRDRERFLAAGMDAFLTKPFGREDLRRTLEALLQGRRPPGQAPQEAGPAEVVDREALLASLTADGRLDREGLRELLDLFERHAPQHLRALADAVAGGDAGAAREAAHSLCGSTAYAYAGGLLAACKAAEEEAGRGDLGALRERLPRLEEGLAAVRAVLAGLGAEFT